MGDLQGHSIYIATRPARLEAREAGFLVFINPKVRNHFLQIWGKEGFEGQK